MTTDHSAVRPGAADRRQPTLATRVQAKLDPMGWGAATAEVVSHALRKPAPMAVAGIRLMTGLAALPVAVAGKALAVPVTPPIAADPRDRRFADPAWDANAYYFAVRQCYDLVCRYVEEVFAAGHTDELTDLKARMTAHLLTDAAAPTNFLLTNPTALRAALDSGGRTLVDGAKLALDDLVERGGMPEKVDASAFALGTDLAATPGAVIFRNDLIELIQYSPQTAEVHEVPLLASPPWINKYYVMDLAPGRSLVEWAVQHGRTVFMISYRNPDSSMSDVTMDDYLEHGVLQAMEVVQHVTGSPKVDVLSLCLGGAMASMTAAHLAARGDDRLGSLTLLNTILDYSEPGELAAFVDPDTLDRIDVRMGETGFLPEDDMALAFDLLRARDLIFRYVPDRWLMGKASQPFDILAWNGDSTRMPASMHSSYLRLLYGENCLARDELELAGEELHLRDVHADVYVVGAVNDHIVLWTSSYAATQLFPGHVRYVLTSGGHIAGVVNPPSPKAWFEALPDGSVNPTAPSEWRAATTRHDGSWWEDWARWSGARAGALVAAPKRLGNRRYRPVEDAPGSYVRG
ncbi:PHA/PHB synthase family protein [Flexivirga caeni]|uniref:Alpha/beta fold hydrolase n=1 Tax=Flexivirga caeni TaxID=2294115 RepID=A0A3M9M548_9MICO|nr:alpha/beta fold hydrolase [Flexivirga caeni]RNI19658.1 alpha/beta fold hydrolase [Flexivirga caeni]